MKNLNYNNLEKNMKKNDSTTKINKYKDTDSQPIKAFTFLWSSLKNIFSKNS